MYTIFDEMVDFVVDHFAMPLAVLGFVLVFFVPLGLIGAMAAAI